MFRTNGYVQDERYTAGAGRAGAVSLKLALHVSQDAQERYLSSWHCMYRRTRRSGISQVGTACIAGRAGAVSLKLALHVAQGCAEAVSPNPTPYKML